MKKFCLTLMVLVACTMRINAQESQMATLTHGTTTTSFYGKNAFVEAFQAAEHGDVITLTGGIFEPTNIEKAITVRGNGAENNELNGTLKTTLSGPPYLYVNIPEGTTYSPKLEGMYLDFNVVYLVGNKASDQATLVKIITRAGVTTRKCSPKLVQCSIPTITNQETPGTIYCTNCLLGHTQYGPMELSHCTIYRSPTADNSIYKNCILVSLSSSQIYNTSNASYCLGMYGDTVTELNLFANCGAADCTMLTGDDRWGLFKDGKTGSECNYELSETAKTTYLGDDGTQVGAYGGGTPFNLTPTNPRIKRFSVLTTNNNNKLNVKLNVE